MIKKEIIGSRVNIEYLDENEEFASILPRSGLIIQRQKTIDGVNN